MEKKIAEAVSEHKITSDVILNFDQISLGFGSRLKTTYIKRNSNDKRIQMINLLMALLLVIF